MSIELHHGLIVNVDGPHGVRKQHCYALDISYLEHIDWLREDTTL